VARVARNALKIAGSEPGADRFIVQAAALLHDIKDWKFARGSDEAGPREATRLLKRLGASVGETQAVAEVIRGCSFKGAAVKTKPGSIEGKIVQDADRLDAIGAIGIARCFAYGGMKRREIYQPGKKPVLHRSFVHYKKSKSHSINHFYEKLLLLKSRMNTRGGRRLAVSRHRFMRDFLMQFFAEWKSAKI
jgi:uncharacterized protein